MDICRSRAPPKKNSKNMVSKMRDNNVLKDYNNKFTLCSNMSFTFKDGKRAFGGAVFYNSAIV